MIRGSGSGMTVIFDCVPDAEVTGRARGCECSCSRALRQRARVQVVAPRRSYAPFCGARSAAITLSSVGWVSCGQRRKISSVASWKPGRSPLSASVAAISSRSATLSADLRGAGGIAGAHPAACCSSDVARRSGRVTGPSRAAGRQFLRLRCSRSRLLAGVGQLVRSARGERAVRGVGRGDRRGRTV